ncbi:MAG: DUF479 domain-containing protein [Flavobacteriales bacterium]|nr:DUF479 domain-containing protein [Flavobacteriales bacterium]
MNYLAHLYLSGDDEGLLIGNYVADAMKGIKVSSFSADIQQGIALHRHIDSFTDHNDHVRESKKRLFEKYKHYAAVIVDVYYDHFLAKNWTNYSDEPLVEYEQRMYDLLTFNKMVLPRDAIYFLKYMMDQNLLSNYANLETIGNSLSGLSRRTKFKSNMEYAVTDLEEGYDLFQADFELFFPELEASVAEFILKSKFKV